LQLDIFNTPNGNHTKAYLQGDNSYVIALVREVIPAKEDKVKLNVIKQELASGSVNDLMEQYNVYLRQRHPVTVNEQLLKRAGQ
jgi:hypothetical protein